MRCRRGRMLAETLSAYHAACGLHVCLCQHGRKNDLRVRIAHIADGRATRCLDGRSLLWPSGGGITRDDGSGTTALVQFYLTLAVKGLTHTSSESLSAALPPQAFARLFDAQQAGSSLAVKSTNHPGARSRSSIRLGSRCGMTISSPSCFAQNRERSSCDFGIAKPASHRSLRLPLPSLGLPSGSRSRNFHGANSTIGSTKRTGHFLAPHACTIVTL